MIYVSMSDKYKKVSFLVLKTRIQKVSKKDFQVEFTLIKHSLKRFLK